MIRSAVLRRFKRFEEQRFDLEGHVVLAGPNNAGKTTLLQAVSAWNVALEAWRRAGDFGKHKGAYALVPIARQAFTAVPVRHFSGIWTNADYQRNGRIIEIEVQLADGAVLAMELKPDSSEQIYVRPRKDADAARLRQDPPRLTYVPPMTGLSTQEPVYQKPKVDQLLGMSRPGEIIRNLLVEAHRGDGWAPLVDSIKRLFEVDLLPPDDRGADIVANYQRAGGGPTFDISAAGSGMQQVLMLLTFLHARPGAVLLLDEPDAHLHVFLQDSIYNELKSVATRNGSQLIMATHSEVIINSVEPRELQLMVGGTPRRLSDVAERTRLVQSLRVLTQSDVMLALDAPGILYVEGHTDLAILREWAKVLGHPVFQWLSTKPFWKPVVWEPRHQGEGIRSAEHFRSLLLVNPNMRAIEIQDGDGRREIPPSVITGQGHQKAWWRRYEIESYLVHPAALERFVASVAGEDHRAQVSQDMKAIYADTHLFGVQELADRFIAAPLDPPDIIEAYLRNQKARSEILPRILTAGGLPGIPYTEFYRIAALMRPEEIHPEVVSMLDSIKQALGL